MCESLQFTFRCRTVTRNPNKNLLVNHPRQKENQAYSVMSIKGQRTLD